MKFLNRFWPWSRIACLENELREERRRRELLEQLHTNAKETIQKKDDHMRSLATIIAIKGGFTVFLLSAIVTQAQPILRNPFTTNSPAPVANKFGVLTNDGAGNFGYTADALLWKSNSNKIGLIGDLKGTLNLGPFNNNRMTNTVVFCDLYGKPIGGDGFKVFFEYVGSNSAPAGMTIIFSQGDNRAVSEAFLAGYYALMQATNKQFTGWLYQQNAAIGNLGQTQTASAPSSGAGIGVLGSVNTAGPFNNGTEGYALANQNAQTNIGTSGITSRGGFTGGANVGVYAEIDDSTGTDPSFQDSVFLGDNRTTALPLLILRSNSVPVLNIDNLGQLTYVATNTAPVNTTTPKKWILINIEGEGTPYRMPLYQ